MWDKVPVVRVDGGGLKPAAVSLLCVFLGVVECRGVCSWKSGLNPVGRRDALHRILAGPESRLNIKRRHSLFHALFCMKAVVASVIGPYADVLSLCSVPKPELVAGTVLVRVLSAGLAFPDVLVVEGKHMMRRDPPFTPGQEICGLVVAVGEGVASVAVGQQVFGPCLSGGLAEFALVDACECFHAPRAMDPHTAAGFELNYGTSWHGLVDLAGLRAGETLLVLGASGGIGLSAIAIGVARGARVVAAASTDARLEACRQAGAHVALSYAGGAPGKALKAALAAAGLYGEVDVVLDPASRHGQSARLGRGRARPSSAPAAPRGAPGGSGQLGTPHSPGRGPATGHLSHRLGSSRIKVPQGRRGQGPSGL